MELSEGSYKHHTEGCIVSAVAVLVDGRIAVSGGNDKSLIMTNLMTKEVICRKENAHKDKISKIAVAPNGSFSSPAVTTQES